MKIEFEIIQKIRVKTIAEEALKNILIAEIQSQIPEATINGVEFVVKRNPTRIELDVDAQYGDATPAPAVKAEPEITPEVVDKTDSIIADVIGKTPAPAKASSGDVASMFKV